MAHSLQPQVDLFHQLAIGGDEVGDQSDHERHRTQHDAQRSQYQGLHVAAAVAGGEKRQVTNAQRDAGGDEGNADPHEQRQRPVDHEYAQDCQQRALDVVGDAADQS